MNAIAYKSCSRSLIIFDLNGVGSHHYKGLQLLWKQSVDYCESWSDFYKLIAEKQDSVIIYLSPGGTKGLEEIADYIYSARCFNYNKTNGSIIGSNNNDIVINPTLFLIIGQSFSLPVNELPFSCDAGEKSIIIKSAFEFYVPDIMDGILKLEAVKRDEIILPASYTTKIPDCCCKDCPGRNLIGLLRITLELTNILCNNEFTEQGDVAGLNENISKIIQFRKDIWGICKKYYDKIKANEAELDVKMRKDIESDLTSHFQGISKFSFEDSKIDSDFGIIRHDFDTHLASTCKIKIEGKKYEYNFEKLKQIKCINLQDLNYVYSLNAERSSWSMLFMAIPAEQKQFFKLGKALKMILAHFELQYTLFSDLGLKNKDTFDKLKVEFDKYIQNGI